MNRSATALIKREKRSYSYDVDDGIKDFGSDTDAVCYDIKDVAYIDSVSWRKVFFSIARKKFFATIKNEFKISFK